MWLRLFRNWQILWQGLIPFRNWGNHWHTRRRWFTIINWCWWEQLCVQRGGQQLCVWHNVSIPIILLDLSVIVMKLGLIRFYGFVWIVKKIWYWIRHENNRKLINCEKIISWNKITLFEFELKVFFQLQFQIFID